MLGGGGSSQQRVQAEEPQGFLVSPAGLGLPDTQKRQGKGVSDERWQGDDAMRWDAIIGVMVTAAVVDVVQTSETPVDVELDGRWSTRAYSAGKVVEGKVGPGWWSTGCWVVWMKPGRAWTIAGRAELGGEGQAGSRQAG
ncbi:hypothetical protein Q7P37_002080 [Cladosporium fusiforme]